MQKICDVNKEAQEKLPPNFQEKSGVGTHYVDAFVKPMNVTLDDGTKVICKRRGLQINLSYGDKKGGGLLRRIDVGPDPIAMLDAALQKAAQEAGLQLEIKDDGIYIGE